MSLDGVGGSVKRWRLLIPSLTILDILKELVDLINGTHEASRENSDGLVISALSMNLQYGSTPEEMRDFVSVHSSFYPDLWRHFSSEIGDYLDEMVQDNEPVWDDDDHDDTKKRVSATESETSGGEMNDVLKSLNHFLANVTLGCLTPQEDLPQRIKPALEALVAHYGSYWYVWINHGDGRWSAEIRATDELIDSVMLAQQIELKSGPHDDWLQAYDKLTEDVAANKRRQINRDPYKPPPEGEVRWGGAIDADVPYDDRPVTADFVVEVSWGDRHSQRYHLDTSPGGRLWLLWQEYVNRSGNSPRPLLSAHMSKQVTSDVVAAEKLLTYVLEEERDEGMNRFDRIVATGRLSVDQINKMASNVWREEEAE